MLFRQHAWSIPGVGNWRCNTTIKHVLSFLINREALQGRAPTRTALPPGRRIPRSRARPEFTLHTVLVFLLSRTPRRVWLLLRACVHPQKERHQVRCARRDWENEWEVCSAASKSLWERRGYYCTLKCIKPNRLPWHDVHHALTYNQSFTIKPHH